MRPSKPRKSQLKMAREGNRLSLGILGLSTEAFRLTARRTEFIPDTAHCNRRIDSAGVGSVPLACLWSRSTV